MASIPGKQLHRAGTTAELQSYLSDREIGYSTDDSLAYIKIEGNLVPLDGGSISTVMANMSSIAQSIAPQFSSDTAYAANDRVMYNYRLYRFTSGHQGPWTGTDVEVASLSD